MINNYGCNIGGRGKTTIHLMGGSVNINGVEINGKGTVEFASDGSVIVNGERNEDLSNMAAANPVFHIHGNVASISTQCSDINVEGDVIEAKTMSGNIKASGATIRHRL